MHSSHEVVLEIAVPVLVATLRDRLFIVHEVVGMITLPSLLLAILLHALLLLLALLLRCSVAIAKLLSSVLALLAEVGVLLDFGLVQAVDDGVESLLDMYSLDLWLWGD